MKQKVSYPEAPVSGDKPQMPAMPYMSSGGFKPIGGGPVDPKRPTQIPSIIGSEYKTTKPPARASLINDDDDDESLGGRSTGSYDEFGIF